MFKKKDRIENKIIIIIRKSDADNVNRKHAMSIDGKISSGYCQIYIFILCTIHIYLRERGTTSARGWVKG